MEREMGKRKDRKKEEFHLIETLHATSVPMKNRCAN
jgi:hypothetical protein